MKILKVQVVQLFFFFVKNKLKIFEKFDDFFKKWQKLKNGYFLDPKSAKSTKLALKSTPNHENQQTQHANQPQITEITIITTTIHPKSPKSAMIGRHPDDQE